VALTLMACAPAADDDESAAEGLLILAAADDQGAVLELATTAGTDGGGLALRRVSLPDPAAAWISAGRASVLATTLLDGTVLTSDPVDPDGAEPLDELEWREVEATDPTGEAPEGPAWFATWDPEGGRFAAFRGDLVDGTDLRLDLVDPSAGSVHEIALDQPVLAAAPMWVDGDHVALVGGTTGEPKAVIVDVTTGALADGPTGHRRLSASADASTVASSGGAGEPVVVHTMNAWQAGARTSIGSVDSPGESATAVSFALDDNGDRLAIVWADESGYRIDIHDGRADWRRVAVDDLPESAPGRAVVSWLR
jgi:hypothetical protein